MAGIGYTLEKLIREDRYTSDLKVNVYCLIISSGPWICAMLCITGLLLVCSSKATGFDLVVFRTIIVYAYAFSLIFSSPFQLILTRFMSDKLYEREYSSLLPNFIGVIILCGFVNLSVSSAYIFFTKLNFLVKVLSVILFCVTGYQWIAMVFFSTLKEYSVVILNFFLGCLVSFFAALFLGTYIGLAGYLAGFLLGQMLLLLLLLDRLFKEFPMGEDKIFAFSIYFDKHPSLLLSAFLYNLGYWADKIILWWSPYGAEIAENSFRYHYPYDTALFLSVLTIIPAMAIFFLQLETEFYKSLRKYINTICDKGSYETIEEKRKNLISLIKTKMFEMGEFQFLITVITCLLSPRLINLLGFNAHEVLPIFITLLFGTFFQVLFLNIIVLFWYLDLLFESAFSIFIFAVLNVIFPYIQIYYTRLPLGTGYLAAIITAFIITLVIFVSRLKDLNYIIFVRSNKLERTIVPMPKFD